MQDTVRLWRVNLCPQGQRWGQPKPSAKGNEGNLSGQGRGVNNQDYWRGTANRLIRISWIDIGGVQTIHRFVHQTARRERSGGLSTA